MTHLRLIYVSRPVGYRRETLDAILATARHYNERNDITGALITREDMYLQLLEGPPAAVDTTYAQIVRDTRHAAVRTLVHRQTSWRLFPDWTMRQAPAADWMWSPEEIAAGRAYKAPRPEVEGLFLRLWREGIKVPARGFAFLRRSDP
ncbi:BLUF domain-containing protein [Puniceibacterium confluentis]|uniref:BLUF domain-containing protein n=1 Tax=Puniceibacterium confluentis TaxID=1958944 RepID=UPI001647F320|nr:BLUF domain-containing protein [Puniceibacterium confluentis]